MSKLGSLKIVEYRPDEEAKKPAGNSGLAVAEAAAAVHSALGGGLEAGVYIRALAAELRRRGLAVEEAVGFPARLQDTVIDKAFTADMVVAEGLIVLVRTEPRSEAHGMVLASALKVTGKAEALLVNFRVPDMRQGIMRATVKKANVTLGAKSGETVN